MSIYTTVEECANSLGMPPSAWVNLTAESGASQPAGQKSRVYVGADAIMQFPIGAMVQVAERAADNVTITRVETGAVAARTAAATYFTLSADMADTYTLAGRGAVRLLTPFSTVTTPAWSDLERLIIEAEDEIDQRCHVTFKPQGMVEMCEWHEFLPNRQYGTYPSMYGGRTQGDYREMYKFKLYHHDIKALLSTTDTAYTGYSGDALAIWMGDYYEEWLNAADPFATGHVQLKTIGRNNDYWLNYEEGWLFFANARPVRGDWQIRIRYRHGLAAYNTALPYSGTVLGTGMRDIKKACRLLVQIEMLQNEQYRVYTPGGDSAGRIEPEKQVEKWEAKVRQLLLPHVESITFLGDL